MGIGKEKGRPFLWLALLAYLACNLYAEHSGRYVVAIPHKLAFATGFVLLWTFTVYLPASAWDGAPAKRRRRCFWLLGLFLYYVWILCNMLFFDAAFGRPAGIPWFTFHLQGAAINLEPFKTIRDYLRAYELGNIRGSLVVVNLAGNLAAFAPMGFFLPALFRPMRNLLLFLPAVAGMVVLVELTQLFTRTGSLDIDDLILNAAGAALLWLVVQAPPIKRRVYL